MTKNIIYFSNKSQFYLMPVNFEPWLKIFLKPLLLLPQKLLHSKHMR